jgi:predicted amidophosphoribosyltransferase
VRGHIASPCHCWKKENIHLDLWLNLYDYKDPKIKKVIHYYKYKNLQAIEPIFAPIILYNVSRLLSLTCKSLDITYPPSSKSKITSRGYNQAQILANTIAKYTKSYLFEGFSKAKHTKSQMSIHFKQERIANLKNTILWDKKTYPQSDELLIIDDITTTLTTLKEIAIEAKKIGYKKVYALTLAH